MMRMKIHQEKYRESLVDEREKHFRYERAMEPVFYESLMRTYGASKHSTEDGTGDISEAICSSGKLHCQLF